MEWFDTECDDTDINSDNYKKNGENTSVDSGNDTMSSSYIDDVSVYQRMMQLLTSKNGGVIYHET